MKQSSVCTMTSKVPPDTGITSLYGGNAARDAISNPLRGASARQGNGLETNSMSNTAASSAPSTSGMTSSASDRGLLGANDLAEWLRQWQAKNETGAVDRTRHKHWTPDRGTGGGKQPHYIFCTLEATYATGSQPQPCKYHLPRHAELHTRYGVFIVEVWPVQVIMKWSAPGRRCPVWCRLAGVHATKHLISIHVRACLLTPVVCTAYKSQQWKLSVLRFSQ